MMTIEDRDRLRDEYFDPAEGDGEDFEERRPVKEYRIEDGLLVEEAPPEEPEPKPRAEEKPESPEGEAKPDGERKPRDGRIAELEQELAAARADFYNYRQRTTRERREVYKRAAEDVVTSMLPVLDNLDRALMVPEEGSAKDVLTGVRMVQRQFLSSLEELGISTIPTKGQPFDPALHDAAGTMPVDNPEEDGMVVDEQLRGYRTKDRILRAARVMVGRMEEAEKAEPAEPAKEMEEAEEREGSDDE